MTFRPAGPKGEAGPPGPGAATFEGSEEAFGPEHHVVTAVDGLLVSISCFAEPQIFIETEGHTKTLLAYGIEVTNISGPAEVHPLFAEGKESIGAIGFGEAGFDVTAENTAVGRLVQINVRDHGCTARGVTTPTT